MQGDELSNLRAQWHFFTTLVVPNLLHNTTGKGASRAYCVLNGNRLKMWYTLFTCVTGTKGAARWGAEVRNERLEPPDTEVWVEPSYALIEP
jgi:hypothetical protein